jgi:hypothetical protein
MVAGKIANMTVGGDRRSDHSANLPNVSQTEAAELLNVSTRTVTNAARVLDEGLNRLMVSERKIVPTSGHCESPSRLLKKFVLKRIFSIFAGATRGLIGRDRRCKGGMGYVFASLQPSRQTHPVAAKIFGMRMRL